MAASFARTRQHARQPIPLHDSSTDPDDFTGSYVLLASREQSRSHHRPSDLRWTAASASEVSPATPAATTSEGMRLA